MKDLIKFVKSSGVYFVGTVLTKLVTFLLLPLYTYYIPPEQNGLYNLYTSYINFFCSVLFLDIWAGIMRFMFDFKKEDRKKPIVAGTVIFLMSTILYTLLLGALFSVKDFQYPFFLYLYGLLMNMQTLAGYVARGYGKNVLYAGGGLVASVVTTAFNIILLVYAHMDYSALFLASCIGYAVNIVIILFGLRKEKLFSGLVFDKSLFREMLRFSLPLCLNSVAYWFVSGYNSMAIANTLGNEANGYYSVASRFGSMIVIFTSAFQMAWQELAFFKSARESQLGEFYSKATKMYFQFLGSGIVVLIPVIYLIYPYMVNSSYGAGKNLVPLYLIGTVLWSLSGFYGNVASAIKKNNLLFITMSIGAVGNVVSLHLLLYLIGLQASNIAMIISASLLCITRVILLRRYMDIRISVSVVLYVSAAAAIASSVYMYGNLLHNILSFAAACAFALFVLRDYIRLVAGKIGSRLGMCR